MVISGATALRLRSINAPSNDGAGEKQRVARLAALRFCGEPIAGGDYLMLTQCLQNARSPDERGESRRKGRAEQTGKHRWTPCRLVDHDRVVTRQFVGSRRTGQPVGQSQINDQAQRRWPRAFLTGMLRRGFLSSPAHVGAGHDAGRSGEEYREDGPEPDAGEASAGEPGNSPHHCTGCCIEPWKAPTTTETSESPMMAMITYWMRNASAGADKGDAEQDGKSDRSITRGRDAREKSTASPPGSRKCTWRPPGPEPDRGESRCCRRLPDRETGK